jgi:hypothetical protein
MQLRANDFDFGIDDRRTVSPHATSIFNASVSVSVGDGDKTLFWEDPWIAGLAMGAIAPDLIKLVWSCIRRARTVQQGLLDASWVQDIAGELSVNAVVQFLKLWAELRNVALGTGSDIFRWKWTASGSFSSKTAY